MGINHDNLFLQEELSTKMVNRESGARSGVVGVIKTFLFFVIADSEAK
jgi:hypothetical protein